jgi:hypothetical protein
MAQQGWYPDPGGQTGMFRYWDGHAWSAVISPTPLPGPPDQYGATPPLPPITAPPSPTPGYPPQADAYSQFQALQATKAKKPVAMWVTIVIGVLVLAAVAYLIASRVFGGVVTEQPTEQPSTVPELPEQACPVMPLGDSRVEHPIDDRVYGGQLSYPRLGDPWNPPTFEDRIPFGRDVASQHITIHPGYEPLHNWVMPVMVGELWAGDGFYSPEQGAGIVNRCIFGEFYGDNPVTAETLQSESYTVDGHPGWITQTRLTFSIPNLPTTSELALVIIVATSELSSSIFYASIPNDAMQYKPDVDSTIAGLRVES